MGRGLHRARGARHARRGGPADAGRRGRGDLRQGGRGSPLHRLRGLERPRDLRQIPEALAEMASLVWLIVWLVKGTPNQEWFGSWNDWAVALLGCLVFDVFSGRAVADSRKGR